MVKVCKQMNTIGTTAKKQLMQFFASVCFIFLLDRALPYPQLRLYPAKIILTSVLRLFEDNDFCWKLQCFSERQASDSSLLSFRADHVCHAQLSASTKLSQNINRVVWNILVESQHLYSSKRTKIYIGEKLKRFLIIFCGVFCIFCADLANVKLSIFVNPLYKYYNRLRFHVKLISNAIQNCNYAKWLLNKSFSANHTCCSCSVMLWDHICWVHQLQNVQILWCSGSWTGHTTPQGDVSKFPGGASP